MSPDKIAKSYCANWSNGKCLGIYYNDDMSIKFCHPLPRCLLALDPIQRCAYFDECVAPMKIKNEKLASEFAQGVAKYESATRTIDTSSPKSCP